MVKHVNNFKEGLYIFNISDLDKKSQDFLDNYVSENKKSVNLERYYFKVIDILNNISSDKYMRITSSDNTGLYLGNVFYNNMENGKSFVLDDMWINAYKVTYKGIYILMNKHVKNNSHRPSYIVNMYRFNAFLNKHNKAKCIYIWV